MKKLSKKKKWKNFIFTLICILLIGIGLYFLDIATETTEFVPFKENNEFEIGVFEEINGDYSNPELENLEIYYDYEKNFGKFLFKLEEEDSENPIKHKMDEIEIEFPGIVDNNSVSVYLKGCNEIDECQDFNYSKKINPKTEIYSFDDGAPYSKVRFSSSKKNELIIYNEVLEINFGLLDEIYPRGEFDIDFDNKIGSGKIIFNLGKKYECYQDCILDLEGAELIKTGKEGELNLIKLKILREKIYISPFTGKLRKDKQSADFEINVTSKEKKMTRDFFLSLGVSMIVSSLLFLLQILYSWVE